MKVLDTQTGQLVDVGDGETILRGLKAGRFKVNLNSPIVVKNLEGVERTVSFREAMPDIAANKAILRTVEERDALDKKLELQSPLAKAETFGRGALGGATMGLSNVAGAKIFGDKFSERGRALAEENPNTDLLGKVAGAGITFATAGAGAAAAAGARGAALAARLGGGAAAQTVAKGATIAGLEEAYFSLANDISKAALDDKDMTMEGVVQMMGNAAGNAGIGFLTGGAVSGGLLKLNQKLAARAAAKVAAGQKTVGIDGVPLSWDNWANKTHPELARGQGFRGMADTHLRQFLQQYKGAGMQFEQLPAEFQKDVLDLMRRIDAPEIGAYKAHELTDAMYKTTGAELGRVRAAIDSLDAPEFQLDVSKLANEFMDGPMAEWLENSAPNGDKISVAWNALEELSRKKPKSLVEAQKLLDDYRAQARLSKADSAIEETGTPKQQVYRLLHEHLANEVDALTAAGAQQMPELAATLTGPVDDILKKHRTAKYLDDQLRDVMTRKLSQPFLDETAAGIAGQSALAGLLSANPLVGLAYAGASLAMRKGMREVSTGSVWYKLHRRQWMAANRLAGVAAEGKRTMGQRLGALLKGSAKAAAADTSVRAGIRQLREQYLDSRERKDSKLKGDYAAIKRHVEHMSQYPGLAEDMLEGDPVLADNHPGLMIEAADRLQNTFRDVMARFPTPTQSSPYLFGKPTPPTDSEMQEFVDYYTGAMSPEEVIANPTPKGVEAFARYYPKHYEQVQSELMRQAAEMLAKGEAPDYTTRMKLSLLSGLTLDASQDPGLIGDLQAMYDELAQAQVKSSAPANSGKSAIVSNELTTNDRLAVRGIG